MRGGPPFVSGFKSRRLNAQRPSRSKYLVAAFGQGVRNGASQARIAGEVGISQIHVSRLTRRALEKLRVEIGSD